MVWLEQMRSRPTVDGEVGVVLLLVLIAVRVCEVEMFWLQDVGCCTEYIPLYLLEIGVIENES